MSNPAPVAINARAATRREIGGVERLAREMARRLPRLHPGRYHVIQPPEALAHAAGHLWEQAVLPVQARDAKLVYSPANLAPLAAAGRNVVVIHDVAALRHPEWYGAAYVAYQRALLPRIASGARHLITVSEFSKGELVEVLGAKERDISVVPNGVDERFTPEARTRSVQAVHHLERPYVLVVGTRIARKNVAALATAARRLEDGGVELVHAGSGRGYMRSEAAGPVRELGYVKDEHMPGLYAGALALAMPSLYEGFGLPCLEAMASGTPVVASNRGALPETTGGAALLLDPDDEAALSETLERVVADRELRDELTAVGLAHAARYSWQRSAEETDAALAALL